ncbi:mobilization protein [Salmonella enterica subsp. enterica serovar Typhimurium]|uniref:MbeD family mobilization/exclusion protein n=1 Tax=Salmonella enterica TaxID=28901 RepID=UPI00084B20A4|nr:MbeD family mobilization/exclusion protein [Salmonella enterica]OEC13650.1 mobilization protein [Salmonella enterica subsp. enterica serovar Typhimurium]
MTELEGHLLNALEHLQQDYMRRLNEWESAFAELQKMHAVKQQNNALLTERVVNLSKQMQLLAGQVDRLRRIFIMNNR